MARRERESAFSDSEDEELLEDDDDDDGGSAATPARLKMKINPKFLGAPKPFASNARRGASKVWNLLRGRVRVDSHPFKGDGTTHLCIYPLEDGSACNTELKLNRVNKNTAAVSTTNREMARAGCGSWGLLHRPGSHQGRQDGKQRSFVPFLIVNKRRHRRRRDAAVPRVPRARIRHPHQDSRQLRAVAADPLRSARPVRMAWPVDPSV